VSNDDRDSCIRIPDMLSDLKNEQLLNVFVITITRFELTKTVTE